MSCGSNNELIPVNTERHRSIGNHPPKGSSPEKVTSASVERMKVAFTIAGKQQVSRRRENPTAGNVRHVESPAFAAGCRVNGLSLIHI